MGFKCGIVGLPNVGKSTLFNALTNSSKAQAENFPFCTIDPNIGIVSVPDKRLDQLVLHQAKLANKAKLEDKTKPEADVVELKITTENALGDQSVSSYKHKRGERQTHPIHLDAPMVV